VLKENAMVIDVTERKMERGCTFCYNPRTRKRHRTFHDIIACEECIKARTIPDYSLQGNGLPRNLFDGLPYFAKSTWSKIYGANTARLYLREDVDRLIREETGFETFADMVHDRVQREREVAVAEQRRGEEKKARAEAADALLRKKRLGLVLSR
jgi:hypothetical protein